MKTLTKIGFGVIVIALTISARIAVAQPTMLRGQCVIVAEASSSTPGGQVYGWSHGACPPQMLSHYALKLKKRVGDSWVVVATSVNQPTAAVACQPFEQFKTKATLWAAEPGGGSAEIDKDGSRIFYCGGT